MPYEIQQIGPESLMLYASVPITFQVRSVLRLVPIDRGTGGIRLVEEPVEQPWVKDYDEDESPMIWPQRFDVLNWAFFLVSDANNRPAGAATVAFDTPGVNMLEGRRDLSVLWDIRIHPEHRGRGLGTRLFQLAADWSRSRRCREMKIETQNINVPACRFYASMGAVLGCINQYGYINTPYADEVMLLWYKAL